MGMSSHAEQASVDNPTADDLLDLSQEDLLDHLRAGAERRLRSRKSLAKGAASTPELRAMSLGKSRDRNMAGGVYSKAFHWDRIAQGHANGRDVPPLRDYAANRASTGRSELRRELAAERKLCHQYKLKKSLPRKPDGGLFED